MIRPQADLRAFLTRDRLVAWATVFLLADIAFLAAFMLEQRGAFGPVGPSSIDFVSFYAAGKLALAGTPALAYDQAAHYLAEQQATMAGAPYVYFYYPPVFLFICAALASLPYLLAFTLYEAGTMLLFLLVLRRVLGVAGQRWNWVWLVLAFPATFWTISMGQNSFLNMALLGGFTLLVDRRPLAAGALLGAMCFKPHLGLLTPVALLAGRHWRAFAAATSVLIGLVLVSAAVFGMETWEAYLTAMRGSQQVYATGAINFAGFVSPFGALRMLGLAIPTAYAIQAAITLAMAGLVAIVWRRTRNLPARAAVLLSTTLLAVPLTLLYDQLLGVTAIAWLSRATARPWQGWEKTVLVACYPIALAAPILGVLHAIPSAVFASLAVVGLSTRRAWLADRG